MAIIHKTTMRPGKVELLLPWLTAMPWYLPTAGAPALDRSGGFRLDDPAGEVGMEFMVLTDVSGGRPTAYHLPLTYRGAPLDGAEAGLIGTSEHGVLGRRWVYDGVHDPVLVAELLALFQGRATAQAQSLSDTPDRSVTARFDGPALTAFPLTERPEVAHTARGTEVLLPGEEGLALSVERVLRPEGDAPAGRSSDFGRLTAGWTAPDGTGQRALFAAVRAAAG